MTDTNMQNMGFTIKGTGFSSIEGKEDHYSEWFLIDKSKPTSEMVGPTVRVYKNVSNSRVVIYISPKDSLFQSNRILFDGRIINDELFTLIYSLVK